MLAALEPTIAPPVGGYDPLPLGPLDAGRVLYQAMEDGTGNELWVTDATASGTRRLKDVTAGASGSTLRFIESGAGFALFAAAPEGSLAGRDVWSTRGTSKSTKAILRAATDSQWITGDSKRFGDRIVFDRSDASTGTSELWISDGTAEGTLRLAADLPDADGPEQFTIAGGLLYFVVTGAESDELWQSDGTSQGTAEVPLEGGRLRLSGIAALGDRLVVGVAPNFKRTSGLFEVTDGGRLQSIHRARLVGTSGEWTASLPVFSFDDHGNVSLFRWDGRRFASVDVGAVPYSFSHDSIGRYDVAGRTDGDDSLVFSLDSGTGLYSHTVGAAALEQVWHAASGPIDNIANNGQTTAFTSDGSLFALVGRRGHAVSIFKGGFVKHVVGISGDKVLFANGLGDLTVTVGDRSGLYVIPAAGGEVAHLSQFDGSQGVLPPTHLIPVGEEAIGIAESTTDYRTHLTRYDATGGAAYLGSFASLRPEAIVTDGPRRQAFVHVAGVVKAPGGGSVLDGIFRVDLATSTMTLVPDLTFKDSALIAAADGQLVYRYYDGDAKVWMIASWDGVSSHTVLATNPDFNVTSALKAVRAADRWVVSTGEQVIIADGTRKGTRTLTLPPEVYSVMDLFLVDGHVVLHLAGKESYYETTEWIAEVNPVRRTFIPLAEPIVHHSASPGPGTVAIDGSRFWIADTTQYGDQTYRYDFSTGEMKTIPSGEDQLFAAYAGEAVVRHFWTESPGARPSPAFSLLREDGTHVRLLDIEGAHGGPTRGGLGGGGSAASSGEHFGAVGSGSLGTVGRTAISTGRHLYLFNSDDAVYRYTDGRLEKIGSLPFGQMAAVLGDTLLLPAAAIGSPSEASGAPLLWRYRPQLSVAGSTFVDADRNGAQNGSEKGLRGWRVFIDKDNDGVLDKNEYVVRASSTGRFEFYDLGNATYTVRVLGYDGYVATNTTAVRLKTGGTTVTKRFGYAKDE